MASGQVDAAIEIAADHALIFRLGMRHKTDSKYD